MNTGFASVDNTLLNLYHVLRGQLTDNVRLNTVRHGLICVASTIP
jgi:hypothetical protein